MQKGFVQAIPALAVGGAVAAFMWTAPMAMQRFGRHHEEAFNALVREAWTRPRDAERMRLLQEYLERGWFHQMWHEPPLAIKKKQ